LAHVSVPAAYELFLRNGKMMIHGVQGRGERLRKGYSKEVCLVKFKKQSATIDDLWWLSAEERK